MNVNLEKRFKKFDTEFYNLKKHPYYTTIKNLYLNNQIKTITSASKQFKKLKLTKTGKIFKSSVNAEKQFIEKVKNIASLKDENELTIDQNNIDNYGRWIHLKMCLDIMRNSSNNDFFQHTVNFYNPSGSLNKKFQPIKLEFNKMRRKNLEKKLEFDLAIGSDFNWMVEEFIKQPGKENPINGRYVILRTYKFEKQENTDNQQRLTQTFRDSESQTCVYDGFLEYFSNINNKMGRSIYNKLIKQEEKYKTSYTVDEINNIAQLCKSTVVIKDLLYFNDLVINESNTNRYRLEFLNTRWNHLTLYKCVSGSNSTEIDKIEYENILKETPYYIEKYGKLYTSDCTYKIKKDDFQITFSEWKDKYNYNTLSIKSQSLAYKFLNSYDYSVHRFINNFPIDDNLYQEIDLKKAYYNYSDKTQNKHYVGIPSGSFICVSCPNDFNISNLNKLHENGLIGFCEIKITKTNDNLDFLGFSVNSIHTLATHTILFMSKYCEFEFINIMYAPSVHIPFDEKFLNVIPLEDDDDTLEDKKGIKYYCKAYGLMLCDSDLVVTTIKPDKKDNDLFQSKNGYTYNNIDNFYQTLTKQEVVHKNGNTYKIYNNIENFNSWKHISYYIHSYTTTQILEQLMNYNVKTDVFGVKLDSIVLKKDVDLKLGSNFDIKNSKIEKLLKNIKQLENNFIQHQKIVNKLKNNNYDSLDDGLDDGLFDGLDMEHSENIKMNWKDEPDEPTNINFLNNGLYNKYKIQLHNEHKFDESFTQSKELIYNRHIFIQGQGGSGKTYSILNSFNLYTSAICYTTSCWNLINTQKENNSSIIGVSIPKLIGEMNGKKVDKYTGTNIRYLIVDEKTLVTNNILKKILKEFPNIFIFVIGDIDIDGHAYQCTLETEKFYPLDWGMQVIKYTKSYRFDRELNNKLIELRSFAKTDARNIYNQCKRIFPNNFKKIEDVQFNDDDVGISCLKNIEDGQCKYSQYFINKGAKPQYVIKNTVLEKNQLKGQILYEKPEHKNYIETLFRTIHSFQGSQLTHNNRIIIYLNSLFDSQLLYTALSRARRVDQIIIIDKLK